MGPILGSVVYEKFNYAIMFRSASLMILIALIIFMLLLPSYYRRLGVLEKIDTELSPIQG